MEMRAKLIIDDRFAKKFAAEWIAAWNSHDLSMILSHYRDDFEMTSPLVVQRMAVASGKLQGKAAISAYWAKGVAASPPLHFTLEAVFPGVDSIVILYRRGSGQRVAEVLSFDGAGHVFKGTAHYEPLAPAPREEASGSGTPGQVR